jgi:hypothetical protein
MRVVCPGLTSAAEQREDGANGRRCDAPPWPVDR